MDGPTLGRVDLVGRRVERFAQDVVDVAEHSLAHRNSDRRAGVLHVRAAHHPVGGLQSDRTNLGLPDVLGDLARDRRRALQLDVDGERRVDLRQLGRREFDVDHGTDHPHHATVHMSVLLGHPVHSLDVWARASAPPTISLISVVISS